MLAESKNLNDVSRNRDVLLISQVLEEINKSDIFKQSIEDLKNKGLDVKLDYYNDVDMLSLRLRDTDSNVITSEGFIRYGELLNKVYRINVGLNNYIYYHCSKKDTYSFNSILTAVKEYFVEVDGKSVFKNKGCNLVSMCNEMYASKGKYPILPSFKIFLESYIKLVDVEKEVNREIENLVGRRDQLDQIEDFDFSKIYSKREGNGTVLDYYILTGMRDVESKNMSTNSVFGIKPYVPVFWDSEYEFIMLSNLYGREGTLKILLLVCLNTLALLKMFQK